MDSVGVRSSMDIASLSKMIGHPSRAMTSDTYADANKDEMILASNKLSDTFKAEGDFLETDEYNRDDAPFQEDEEVIDEQFRLRGILRKRMCVSALAGAIAYNKTESLMVIWWYTSAVRY